MEGGIRIALVRESNNFIQRHIGPQLADQCRSAALDLTQQSSVLENVGISDLQNLFTLTFYRINNYAFSTISARPSVFLYPSPYLCEHPISITQLASIQCDSPQIASMTAGGGGMTNLYKTFGSIMYGISRRDERKEGGSSLLSSPKFNLLYHLILMDLFRKDQDSKAPKPPPVLLPDLLANHDLTNSQDLFETCSVGYWKRARFDHSKSEEQPGAFGLNTNTYEFNEDNEFKKSFEMNSLENVMKKQKVNRLVKNFKVKIKRNLTKSRPVLFETSHKTKANQMLEGLEMPSAIKIVLRILTVAQFLSALIFYGLAFAFNQSIRDTKEFMGFQLVSMLLLIVEMVMRSVCKRQKAGKRLSNVVQIFQQYYSETLGVDCLCLVCVIVDIGVRWDGMRYLRMIFLLRINHASRCLSIIQNSFLNTFYKEQYWSVAKVFFLNFIIAHIIGVILAALASHEGSSWMQKMGISGQPWTEKYWWAYYWAMSTMLGFGNASPANSNEAIYISIIMCVSCILLAYNINYVGILITNIAQQNIEMQTNLKTSKRLAEENQLTEQLQSKINNFIIESDAIKKKFFFQTDRQFVLGLPPDMKTEFLKEANKKIFQSLFFFKDLSKQAFLKLAEKIEIRISHPQQVLFEAKDRSHLLILKTGRVGYYTASQSKEHKSYLTDTVEVKKKCQPKLLHLLFFNKNQHPEFRINALDYSIVYFMAEQAMMEIIREVPSDLQKFCYLRDKSRHLVDEFETVECQTCETNHTKMKCHRLHYSPYKDVVALKHLKAIKKEKNKRRVFIRQKKNSNNIMDIYYEYFKRFDYCLKNSTQSKRKVQSEKRFLSKFDRQHKIPYQISETLNLIDSCSLSLTDGPIDSKTVERFKELRENMEDLLKMQVQNNKIEQQSFWDLEVDSASNYSFYFPQSNPSTLKEQALSSNMDGTTKTWQPLKSLAESLLKLNWKMKSSIGLSQII